jgi:hypothetical protein
VSYVFVKDKPLGWGQSEYSYYYGLKFFLNAVALFAILPLVRRLWSPSDTSIAIVSVLSKIAGLVLLGVSTSSAMVYSGELFHVIKMQDCTDCIRLQV